MRDSLLPPRQSSTLRTPQVVYGLAGGLVVPGLAVMIARWEPQSERGRLASLVYSGSQASAVISSLLTGFLSHHHQDQFSHLIGPATARLCSHWSDLNQNIHSVAVDQLKDAPVP